MIDVKEILESKGKFLQYLNEHGYKPVTSYVDEDYPKSTFVELGNKELLAICECKNESEIRQIKNHFLIDNGITHCAILLNKKIIFFRSYGEIKYFIYSTRTADNISKIDKLKDIGDNFNTLFKLKDISNDFYETFRLKRDILVKNIENKIDDVQKYLIAQKIFDRIFFTYFLCHKGIVRHNTNQIISGRNLFRILLENGNFVENLYHMFNNLNTENNKPLVVGEYTFHFPFLNGGLFRLEVEEHEIDIKLKQKDWENIFSFLNSYNWIIEDDVEEEEKILTPEILGHVYERSVVEWEKKGIQKAVEEAVGKTERKITGVYYTPEVVTDYICKNTIYSFLLKKLGNKFETIRYFFDHAQNQDFENALEILNTITVLDPACGSGAFLLKAADIIFKLKSNIQKKLGKKSLHYKTKLDVITTNIYGVDLLQGATEIAKLRLWLWLISSYLEEKEITPLPNIEYNVTVGNSLVGWTNEPLSMTFTMLNHSVEIKGIFMGLLAHPNEKERLIFKKSQELLETLNLENYGIAYSLLYNVYKNSHTYVASSLKEILSTIRNSIYQSISKSLINYVNSGISKKNLLISENLKTMPFHWRFDFGDIIKKGGFDVVIGNPPYVRVESLDHDIADYMKIKYASVHERCDLYVPFIQKCFELVNPDGEIGLIVQNQFMIAEYGRKLRVMIPEKWGLVKIIDFTNYTPFHEVSTYSCIILGIPEKRKEFTAFRITSEHAVRYWEDHDFSESIVHPCIEKFTLQTDNLSENEWIIRNSKELKILKKFTNGCDKKLGDGEIATVTSPLVSGRDEILCAQIIGEKKDMYQLQFADNKTVWLEKGIWKPILRKENIKKWIISEPLEVVFFPYVEEDDEFNLISEHDFKNQYPQTYKTLYNFKEILLDRRDSRQTWREKGLPWYSLHRLGTPKNHIKGKIVTGTVINKSGFSFDSIGFLIPHGGVCGVTPNQVDPYFLQGYLNSKIVYYFMKTRGAPKRGGYISIDVGLVESIPIPTVDSMKQKVISKIVKDIIDLRKKKSDSPSITDLDTKLNEQVFSLFDFTPEEVKIIENSINNSECH